MTSINQYDILPCYINDKNNLLEYQKSSFSVFKYLSSHFSRKPKHICPLVISFHTKLSICFYFTVWNYI